MRDLLNHVTGGGYAFATALRGGTLPTDGPTDRAGDVHRSASDAAVAGFSSVLVSADDLDRLVTLPFGTLPAAVAQQLAAGPARCTPGTWPPQPVSDSTRRTPSISGRREP